MNYFVHDKQVFTHTKDYDRTITIEVVAQEILKSNNEKNSNAINLINDLRAIFFYF